MPWYSNPENLQIALVLLALILSVLAVAFYVLFLQHSFVLKENIRLSEGYSRLESQIELLSEEVSRFKSTRT